jgi:predicted DCC family thiol-disulfide oxidoreductase YuxK
MTARLHHIFFYDGVCGLCDRTVHFLLTRDRRDRLRFAPLQGQVAAEMLPPLGGRPEDLNTMYLVTRDGRLLQKSRAVLFAVAALGGAWSLVSVFKIVPRPLADAVYSFVARVRYRLFGKYEACAIPSREERARFLEASVPEPQTSSSVIGR